MKIYYGKAIYDKKEINASISVLKNKSLTLIDGPSVKKLEQKISKLFGKKRNSNKNYIYWKYLKTAYYEKKIS